MLLWLSTVNKI